MHQDLGLVDVWLAWLLFRLFEAVCRQVQVHNLELSQVLEILSSCFVAHLLCQVSYWVMRGAERAALIHRKGFTVD
jgi:hypothetical protein